MTSHSSENLSQTLIKSWTAVHATRCKKGDVIKKYKRKKVAITPYITLTEEYSIPLSWANWFFFMKTIHFFSLRYLKCHWLWYGCTYRTIQISADKGYIWGNFKVIIHCSENVGKACCKVILLLKAEQLPLKTKQIHRLRTDLECFICDCIIFKDLPYKSLLNFPHNEGHSCLWEFTNLNKHEMWSKTH